MKKTKICAGLFGIVLIIALVFAGCALDVGGNATEPEIAEGSPENQTVELPYADDTISVRLKVSVKQPASGTLSYQWYSYTTTSQYNSKNGTPVANGTTDTVDVDVREGLNRFYVMVTNTVGTKTATAQSQGVLVTVNREGVAVYPQITRQPQDTTIAKTATTINVIPLSVLAEVSDAGELSYQWYKTEDPDEDGEEIEDATDSTYTPELTEEGTYYYYVVVTNTLASNNTKNSTTSDVAVYTVTNEPATVNNTVTVDIGTKYQYVRGFGGMSVVWDNFPDDTVADYETMFNPDRMGLNMIRIMVPPDNTNINETMRALTANELSHSTRGRFYTNNPTVTPPVYGTIIGADGEPVDIVKDQSDWYELVKTVNKYNGYVLASPWSPPAEWKTNSSINGGGTLRTANYVDMANYLRRFSEIMYENGAPIYAISLQNEPSFTAEYDGCEYSQAQHAAWWRTAGVGHFTDDVIGFGGGQEIPSVRTMSGEAHNEITYLNSVVQNDAIGNDARQYIDILGRHIYGVETSSPNGTGSTFLTLAHNHPTDPKEVWMTEWNLNSQSTSGYPNDSTWRYLWGFMNSIDYTIRFNHENAFIWWAAKRFYSLIGDGTYGTTAGAVLPRGHGLSHYAKFAKETGRVGVTVSGSATGVNPTSSYSNTNTGAKITAFVTLNDDFYAGPVETRNRRWKGLDNSGLTTLSVDDISTISLVMFTPTNTSGANGTNMGTVKIDLPNDFIIGATTAMRSTETAGSQPDSSAVIIGADRKSAFVTLPASTVFSVRFEKQKQ